MAEFYARCPDCGCVRLLNPAFRPDAVCWYCGHLFGRTIQQMDNLGLLVVQQPKRKE